MNLAEIEAQYATQIIKYRALLEQGGLTEEEYRELVFELLHIGTIKQKLTSETDIMAAEKLLKALTLLAGLPPK